MPKYLIVPQADGDNLARARISNSPRLTGLMAGTSYIAYVLSDASPAFTAGGTIVTPPVEPVEPIEPVEPGGNIDEIINYVYQNSLFDHQASGGLADDDTRIPNWMARMTLLSGKNYRASGFFGFANQWPTPPTASVLYENVQGPDGVPMWTYTWEGYSAYNVLTFVPDNFESVTIPPNVNSQNSLSPIGPGNNYVDRIVEIIDLWDTNAPNPNRRYCVYAGWADHNANYGEWNNYTPAQLNAYLTWSRGGYHQWYVDLVAGIKAARPNLNVELVDVQRVMMNTWQGTVLRNLTGSRMWEDNSPHGTETWYLLAAMIYYMEMYREKPPANFNPHAGTGAGAGVDALLRDNWSAIVDYAWNELGNDNTVPVDPVEPTDPTPTDPTPTEPGQVPSTYALRWRTNGGYQGPATIIEDNGAQPTIAGNVMSFSPGSFRINNIDLTGYYSCNRIRVPMETVGFYTRLVALTNTNNGWSDEAAAVVLKHADERVQLISENRPAGSSWDTPPPNGWADIATFDSHLTYADEWMIVETWWQAGVNGLRVTRSDLPEILVTSEARNPVLMRNLRLMAVEGEGTVVQSTGMWIQQSMPTDAEAAAIRTWVGG